MSHKTICIRCSRSVFSTVFGPVHEYGSDHAPLTREQWAVDIVQELNETTRQDAAERIRTQPTGFLGNPWCD